VRGLIVPLDPTLDPIVHAAADGELTWAHSGERTHGAWRDRLGADEFVAAPVRAFGQLVAIVVVERAFDARRVDGTALERVRAYAELCGVAVERRRLATERDSAASRVATLAEASTSVAATSSARAELALLVRAAAQTVHARGAVLWRVVGPRRSLVLESVHVSDDHVDPLRQAEALEPMARAVVRDRAPRAAEDAATEPHLDPSAVRGFGPVLVVPVGTNGSTSAALALWGPVAPSVSERGRFGREEVRFAEAIAALAALVLAQAGLSDRVRKAEQDHQDAQKQLVANDKLAALGTVGAKAAIEMRQPLASIGGFARRVHRALAADDPNREYVEIILREADRIERLIEEQIHFAEVNRPRLALESVNTLLGNTLTEAGDTIAKKRVRVLRKLASDVPTLLLDGAKIRQVVKNILDNAIENTPPNARVRVETRRAQGYVVVEIASEGPPLAGDLLEQLFVPFAAARRSGDAVGLALAQQVVQSHGGEIRVRSEGDWGVIFSFTLPVVENQDRRRPADRRGQRSDRRNRFPAA
jgi:signal transduction histidine kinase